MSNETVDENYLHTLYATNRKPVEKLNQKIGYTILPSDTLRLGFVVHSAGGEGMEWEDLKQQSLKTKQAKDLLLNQEYVKEIVQYSKGDDLSKTSSQADGFFDRINNILDKTLDKDILVYVHGANSNFYRASAQGTQYFHFTGHNSLVLTFSWPSAENILKYKVDVRHAKKTVPAFARLGRPDASELNEKEKQVLIAAMKTPRLDVLDVGRSKALDIGGAHDSWYNHPWVSNDLLLLFLFKANPEDRGLEKFFLQSGAEVYLFPLDYDSRVKQIIDEHRDEVWQKAKVEVLQEVQW